MSCMYVLFLQLLGYRLSYNFFVFLLLSRLMQRTSLKNIYWLLLAFQYLLHGSSFLEKHLLVPCFTECLTIFKKIQIFYLKGPYFYDTPILSNSSLILWLVRWILLAFFCLSTRILRGKFVVHLQKRYDMHLVYHLHFWSYVAALCIDYCSPVFNFI